MVERTLLQVLSAERFYAFAGLLGNRRRKQSLRLCHVGI